MTAPGRALRGLLVAGAIVLVADMVSHHLLREPRRTPDHRMGADGEGPAAPPLVRGSPR